MPVYSHTPYTRFRFPLAFAKPEVPSGMLCNILIPGTSEATGTESGPIGEKLYTVYVLNFRSSSSGALSAR